MPISAVQHRDPVIRIYAFFFSYYPLWPIHNLTLRWKFRMVVNVVVQSRRKLGGYCNLHLSFLPFFFFFLLRAMHATYGNSQARGRIGPAAAGLHHSHSNTGSKLHICDLHHSSWQHQILNPLSKTRDRNPILMDASRVRHH